MTVYIPVFAAPRPLRPAHAVQRRLSHLLPPGCVHQADPPRPQLQRPRLQVFRAFIHAGAPRHSQPGKDALHLQLHKRWTKHTTQVD